MPCGEGSSAGAFGSTQQGRAVLQAYVEEAAQLRAERLELRGALQASAISSKAAERSMEAERAKLRKLVCASTPRLRANSALQ